MARFLIAALLVLSACAPVYVPNVRNSPMLTKAGEFQASIQTGNGLELFGPQSVAATGKYERYFLQPAFGVNRKELELISRTTFFRLESPSE